MPGYKDWIDAIDIKVDYFSAFMKAWIAFNAWYNFSGEVTGNSDKECIEYIASQSNRFKTYTMNLINAEDAISRLLTGPLVWNRSIQAFRRISELVHMGIISSMISLAATSEGLRAM